MFGCWGGRQVWLLVGQIVGRIAGRRECIISQYLSWIGTVMRKYRRLLYSFHHALAVPKHLHSGLSLLLYGESYDPGRIGTDRIGF